MGAPLTIEQIILNHNIGVNLSDADTFQGKPLTDFSLVGHKHAAADITSGIFHPDRIPIGTTTSRGAVTLSSSTDSNSETLAATPYAVRAVKNLAAGKANAEHDHGPGDITTSGTFPVALTATSTDATNVRQIRNILIGTAVPTGTLGQDGDIYFQYE